MLISFNHILRIGKYSLMEVGDSIIKNLLSSEFYVIPFSIFLSRSIFRIFYSFGVNVIIVALSSVVANVHYQS